MGTANELYQTYTTLSPTCRYICRRALTEASSYVVIFTSPKVAFCSIHDQVLTGLTTLTSNCQSTNTYSVSTESGRITLIGWRRRSICLSWPTELAESSYLGNKVPGRQSEPPAGQPNTSHWRHGWTDPAHPRVLDKISKNKISNRKVSKAKYRKGKIRKANIEKTKYQTAKHQKTKYRKPKYRIGIIAKDSISNRQNL